MAKRERLMRTHMSDEVRLYIWLKIDPDELHQVLPDGWAAQQATGLLQGANLAVVLIEGIAASDTHGKPLPTVEHFAVVAVPAKNEQVGSTAFIVIDGLATPATSAPGAYGVYKPARVAIERRSSSQGAMSAFVEERWDWSSDVGDRIYVRIAYERGVGIRKHIEPRIYSGLKPTFYRIYKIDQVDDLIHTIHGYGPKAKTLEFRAAGGRLSDLRASEEKLVGIVSVPTYYREVFLPEER
ncbi:hypothetical protein BK022_13265 [Methylorubrum extorquens]|uniref:Acetoacetate decarboxylase n=1 Tax=Methylorubrum extorquens TaxID=408 RepID=A0A1S1P530_METEX|nr:hypothetical protein BK022_13265 [Methylorubrum extorquens]